MKHTDFYQIIKAIKSHEKKELIAAVIAHGDVVEFVPKDEDGHYDDANTDCPVVLASTKYADEASDYNIVKVVVDHESGVDWLTIYGIEKEYGYEPEIVEVEAGHIGYIIDYIPETNAVKDVSIALKPEELLNNEC